MEPKEKHVVSESMEKSKPSRMLSFIYWTLTTQGFRRKMGCIAVWLFSTAEQFAFSLLKHSRRASTSRKTGKKNQPLHTSAWHWVSFDVLIWACFQLANWWAAMWRSSCILLKNLASVSWKHSSFFIISAHLEISSYTFKFIRLFMLCFYILHIFILFPEALIRSPPALPVVKNKIK